MHSQIVTILSKDLDVVKEKQYAQNVVTRHAGSVVTPTTRQIAKFQAKLDSCYIIWIRALQNAPSVRHRYTKYLAAIIWHAIVAMQSGAGSVDKSQKIIQLISVLGRYSDVQVCKIYHSRSYFGLFYLACSYSALHLSCWETFRLSLASISAA